MVVQRKHVCKLFEATHHVKITIPQGKPWKFQDTDPECPTFHKMIKMYEQPATITLTANLCNSL